VGGPNSLLKVITWWGLQRIGWREEGCTTELVRELRPSDKIVFAGTRGTGKIPGWWAGKPQKRPKSTQKKKPLGVAGYEARADVGEKERIKDRQIKCGMDRTKENHVQR